MNSRVSTKKRPPAPGHALVRGRAAVPTELERGHLRAATRRWRDGTFVRMRALARVLVVVGLVSPACFVDAPPSDDTTSFGATTAEPTTGAASSASSDLTTAGPMGCAVLDCDLHATCIEGPAAACMCNEGYTGDGITCTPVTTCADDPCPDGLCADIPDGFLCVYPATCAEVVTQLGAAADGAYTLFLAGDPARPWPAYCHDMQGTPREYLDLPAQQDGANTSRYVAADGKLVSSRHARIRLAPDSLIVDISDATFVTTTGTALHDGKAVAGVWFGVAMTCNSNTIAANVDLSGTPFVIDAEFCGGGFDFKGEVMKPSPRVREITGGGNCGWYAPLIDACPFNPIDDDAVKPGEGESLRLAYSPG